MTKKDKIHEDNKRLAWIQEEKNGQKLYIQNKNNQKTISIYLNGNEYINNNIPAPIRKAISQNANPDDYQGIQLKDYRGNEIMQLCIPKILAPAIINAIQKIKNQKASPATQAYNKILQTIDKAERLSRSDSEDNVTGSSNLYIQAQQMLKDWVSNYPEDARRKKIEQLLINAKAIMRSAIITTDADGWLTSSDQDTIKDNMLNEANNLREQANNLKK